MEWSASPTMILATVLFMTFLPMNYLGGLSGARSATHPYCITYTKLENSEKWTPYHSTEHLSRTKNATFSSKVRIPYLLKDNQELKFEVYSQDGQEQEFYSQPSSIYKGYVESKLKDILKARKVVLPIENDAESGCSTRNTLNLGHVIVQAEKLDNKYDEVILNLHDKDLKGMSLFKSPKHFFEIFKLFEKPEEDDEEGSGDEDDYALVYRTQVKEFYIHDCTVVMPFNTFCSRNRNLKLKFVCWDREDYVGEFSTTVDEVENRNTEFTLRNEKNNPVGEVRVSDFIVNPVPSFSDFMANGLELNVTIAIDYTRNNGLPQNPEGFHYRKNGETKYEKALRLVVNAFENYNWRNTYSVRLFGARKEGQATPLDDYGISTSWETKGINQVLEEYRKVLTDTSIKQGEQVNLVSLLKRIKENAQRSYLHESSKNYYVLVILMVGDLKFGWDHEQALKSALSGDAPLSIIFVGIDDTDFKKVKKAASKVLMQNEWCRDILYFVPFRESDAWTSEGGFSYRQVELLAKLPDQVVSFMHSKEIRP